MPNIFIPCSFSIKLSEQHVLQVLFSLSGHRSLNGLILGVLILFNLLICWLMVALTIMVTIAGAGKFLAVHICPRVVIL